MLRQVPPSKKASVKALAQSENSEDFGTFTEEELDHLLDPSSIAQEIAEMYRKGVAPKQITADVTEIIRWQDKLQQNLEDMSKATPGGQPRPWVTDLIEDLIAYEISPSHTPEEAKSILKELQHSFIELENSGFGPEVRNFVSSLKSELEILTEKIDATPKS